MQAIAVLLFAALALAGTADATCTCDALKGVTNTYSCAREHVRGKSPCYCAPITATCYTQTPDKKVKGHPIKPKNGAPGHATADSCYLVYSSTGATIDAIGAACIEGECDGFSIAYVHSGLKVCYYAKVDTLENQHNEDDRCMGVWVRKPECKKPPPSEHKDPTCDAVKHAPAHNAALKTDAHAARTECEKKYAAHAPNAVHKCLECIGLMGLANNGICFTCPAYSNDAAVQCLDCVITAKDEPAKRKCPCCEHYYGPYSNDGHTGGSTMRCYDCIRSLNVAVTHATTMGYTSVAGQCLDFCRLQPSKAFPYMSTATQCLNCVAHVGAGKFCQLSNNPNGECNGNPAQCSNPNPRPL